MEVSECVCLYYLQYTWCSKDDSAICCAPLLYIPTSHKVCITCQSLAHTAGTESKLMEGLHLRFKCYTLHDNLKTKVGQINASKCSVVLRNMYRTPNLDWRQIHTQITFPCSVSLVDTSIHHDWQSIIRKFSFLPKFLLNCCFPHFSTAVEESC